MKSKAADLYEVLKYWEEGKLKVYIDSVFPLERITEAHRKAEEYHAGGKIVITI
jgi:NADPH:quinone reductase-like Zn-dependent oxidoreductase